VVCGVLTIFGQLLVGVDMFRYGKGVYWRGLLGSFPFKKGIFFIILLGLGWLAGGEAFGFRRVDMGGMGLHVVLELGPGATVVIVYGFNSLDDTGYLWIRIGRFKTLGFESDYSAFLEWVVIRLGGSRGVSRREVGDH